MVYARIRERGILRRGPQRLALPHPPVVGESDDVDAFGHESRDQGFVVGRLVGDVDPGPRVAQV
jgi:hypothetical protein